MHVPLSPDEFDDGMCVYISQMQQTVKKKKKEEEQIVEK